jgi:glycosyltransferase involved in cell wall biosynthesis
MMGKEFKNQTELYDIGWYKNIVKSKFSQDIIMPGYVNDDQLIEYYKNAKVFVFPSLYEGFGLPVLESMSLGAPVVAFKNSSITEIAENAALLCKDNEEFIGAVKRLLENNKLRKSLIEKGYKQARKFSWEKTAKQTLEVIEDLGKLVD